MKTFLKNNKEIICILLLSILLILPKISQVDFISDNAVYAVRSVGYLDYMFSANQPTTLDFYDEFPWWANLSFHDHPFLLFFIQNIFLRIHESIFFAKLPYVILSLGTIIMVYLWIKKDYGKEMALWSSFLLSLNSLFIYTARAGFMEAGVIFFTALFVYFFSQFLKDDKYWPYFGITLGLCFLSKYNTFFLVPSALAFIILKYPDLLKNKRTYYGFLASLAVSMPFIIYNIMLYKTLGHFDFEFSRLFCPWNPWDITEDLTAIGAPWEVLSTLGKSVLFPYLILSITGLVCALYRKKMLFIFLNIIFLTVFFMIVGVGIHYANLFNIFLAPSLAYLIVESKNYLKEKPYKNIRETILFIFIIYLFLNILNSHYLINPVFQKNTGWLISSAQSKNYGIYQLDKYIDKMIKENNITESMGNNMDMYYQIKKKKKSLLDKYGGNNTPPQKPVPYYDKIIVYDINLNWFAELWPFTRRRFYHNSPIITLDDLELIHHEVEINDIYFIKTTENTFLESKTGTAWRNFPDEFEKSIIDNGFQPIGHIYRTDGKEAFRVYKIGVVY